MGLYKLCKHQGRERDRCADPWWGSYQLRGRLFRVSLARWAGHEVTSKTAANAVLDDMRRAIREGSFKAKGHAEPDLGPMTFDEFANLYITRYVQARELASADTIDYRMAPIRRYFGTKRLADIRQADVEDFITELKKPPVWPSTRRPSGSGDRPPSNRYISLLRHMLNWAVGREYLDRSPMRRGNLNLIPRRGKITAAIGGCRRRRNSGCCSTPHRTCGR